MKGRKTGGRKRGSLNKKTVTVKAIMAEAPSSAAAAGKPLTPLVEFTHR
jgi:hypothetical protein